MHAYRCWHYACQRALYHISVSSVWKANATTMRRPSRTPMLGLSCEPADLVWTGTVPDEVPEVEPVELPDDIEVDEGGTALLLLLLALRPSPIARVEFATSGWSIFGWPGRVCCKRAGLICADALVLRTLSLDGSHLGCTAVCEHTLKYHGDGTDIGFSDSKGGGWQTDLSDEVSELVWIEDHKPWITQVRNYPNLCVRTEYGRGER